MAIYIERWPTLYALNTITELELTHTQNITGNYTTVSYAVRVKRINNYNDNWTPSGGSYTTLSIGGISVLNGARHNWTTLSNNANHTATVVSGSVNVPHAANGTKTIAYSLTFRPNVSSIGNIPNRVISGSFTPPAIPRVSKATISKASFNFGEAVTLTTNRASTAFTHKVYYIDSAGTVTLSTNMAASGSITVPVARMSSHTKTASVAMTIRVITVSGGVDIGTHNISVTVNVPSSVIPTVGSLAIAETVTKAANVFDTTSQFISGVSRVKATAGSVSGVHGSTITRYYFRVKEVTSVAMNSTANNVTFPAFNFPSSGSAVYTIQVRVMDSRGRYSSWRDASVIRVHYYRPPTIGNPTTIRLSTPTTLQVLRNYSVQAINQGGTAQRNTASYYIRTRPVGSTTWTTNANAKNTQLSLTNSSANLAGSFSASTMWEVQAVVTDKLNTAVSAVITVSTEFATMEILKGTGIGVGKAPVAGQANLQVGTAGVNSEGLIRYNGNSIQHHVLTHATSGAAITVSGDWNNVIQTGFYQGSTMSNASPGSHSWRWVRVTRHNDLFTLQESFSFGGDTAYYRAKVNGTWYAWNSLDPTDHFISQPTSSTNLNSMVKSGAYRMAGDNANMFPNGPYSQMLTVRGGNDTVAQIGIPYSAAGHRPSIRSGNPADVGGNGSWGPWRELAWRADIPAASAYYTTGGSGFDRWVRFSSGQTIAWGRHSSSSSAANFSFSKTFSAAPLVTLNASIADFNPGFNLTGISTTSFSISVVDARNGGLWNKGTYMVHYQATGMS